MVGSLTGTAGESGRGGRPGFRRPALAWGNPAFPASPCRKPVKTGQDRKRVFADVVTGLPGNIPEFRDSVSGNFPSRRWGAPETSRVPTRPVCPTQGLGQGRASGKAGPRARQGLGQDSRAALSRGVGTSPSRSAKSSLRMGYGLRTHCFLAVSRQQFPPPGPVSPCWLPGRAQ